MHRLLFHFGVEREKEVVGAYPWEVSSRQVTLFFFSPAAVDTHPYSSSFLLPFLGYFVFVLVPNRVLYMDVSRLALFREEN
jgi:hypothetical protein